LSYVEASQAVTDPVTPRQGSRLSAFPAFGQKGPLLARLSLYGQEIASSTDLPGIVAQVEAPSIALGFLGKPAALAPPL